MRARFPLLALAVLASTVVINLAPATAPAAAAAWPIRGIDVSKYQQPPYGSAFVDWARVKADGVDFVIIKATDGKDKRHKEPMFTTNRDGALAQGLTIGMYHVATPVADPADAREEADHFVQAAAPSVGNIIPALDIELSRIPDGMTPSVLEGWMRAWLTRVTNRLGVRPMVYGSVYLFTTKLANTTWFADNGFPLWLARWGPLPNPLPANNWQGQGWTFWQWAVTDPGSVDGITTAIDRDRYVGPDLAYAEIASITAEPGDGGTITDSTGKIACAATTPCTALYSPGDAILLTATPDPGYALVSWGGACAYAGNAPTCSVTTLDAQTVSATFSYRVRVKVDGKVAGRVTSTPAGIDCPGDCAAPFAPSTSVTLTATTQSWNDVTWSGDCTGTDPNGCTVLADQARNVTATFSDLGPPVATITPPGSRTGPIKVTFDEPVHHVTSDNVLVRPVGGVKLAGRLRCFKANGRSADCVTGNVRTVTLQPRDPLRRGVDYVAIVDPAGVGPIRDGVGKAAPFAKRAFSF
jgi:GH25 family lysozyme M1 (1,4-beta-N-acetylmuramidase)